MNLPPPSRFSDLTAGSIVTKNTRGYAGTRTAHTVESATSDHLVVDGESFRRCDGRQLGSAPHEYRCPILEVC